MEKPKKIRRRRKKTEKQFAEQSGTWFFWLLFPTFTRMRKKNFSYWLEFLIFRLSFLSLMFKLKTWALSNFIADRWGKNLNWKQSNSSSFSFFGSFVVCFHVYQMILNENWPKNHQQLHLSEFQASALHEIPKFYK